MSQAKQIREFLKWLDTCPFKHRISSMQGDTVCFVRFWLEETGQLTKEEQESQKLSNLLEIHWFAGTMQKKDTTDTDEQLLAEKDLQDELPKMPNVQNSQSDR